MAIGCAALSYVLFTILHACQFVVGGATCVLYGIDIKHARDAAEAVDGKAAYAVAVGGLGALTALLLLVPFVVRFAFVWVWSLVLCVLWLALFGIFGRVGGVLFLGWARRGFANGWALVRRTSTWRTPRGMAISSGCRLPCGSSWRAARCG